MTLDLQAIKERRAAVTLGEFSHANINFIHCAPADVDALLAEVERLTAERDDAQKELNKWLDWRLNGPVPCYSGKA